jgi:hypothetical protein
MRWRKEPSEDRPLAWAAKVHLGVEILLVYARVRWLVGRRELPQTVELLRVRGRRRRSRLTLADGARWGDRLGAAVGRTLAPLPTNTLCLNRSLVLLAVLARRGADGELVIAVQPDEVSGLGAHAWIELDGRPLLPPAATGYGRLVTL